VRIRWLVATALVTLAVGGAFAGQAIPAGPGGWDHLGDAGVAGTDSLNANVNALNADAPGLLLVGGEFTDAGGNPAADHIASWNGTGWSPLARASGQINGGVFAIAYANGKVYAGGSFTDAGGNANADHLAVWDGQTWAPFCNSTTGGPSFGGNVKALQVVGPTLYVGGEFVDGAGIASADALVACDLATGNASTTVIDPAHPFGSVQALAVDASGVLYAGGSFTNLENIPAADNVAFRAGGVWNAMGAGGGACGCAVTTFVRSLTTVGSDVYVGTDASDVAGIAQADNVARWNGSAWSAVGAGAGGTDGWFPPSTSINALTSFGSQLFATGSFLDAGGDPAADNVAVFDGSAWHAVGSDGAGNGPWSGSGSALAVFDRLAPAGAPRSLYAGGGFTSAGGDTQARGVASFSLTSFIAQPTPVATPTPAPAPTPVPTPTPGPAPGPDKIAPAITALRLSSTTFRAAPSGAPFRAAAVRVGAFVSFTLSEPGTVRFTIDRSTTGRTVKGRCVKTSRSNRSRRSCRRWVAVKGSFTVPGKRGANRIELRGRLDGRSLKPGSYRLAARETDRAANRSRIRRTAFRIVR